MSEEHQYDVALSFADEDRPYVSRVAAALEPEGIRLFYDEYERVNLWGKDLYAHLSDVYRKAARYTVVFISEHYSRKLWTNHERASAQARAFEERREYILPARFDDTEIPGILPTTGYIDLRDLQPEEFAQYIVQKLGGNTPRRPARPDPSAVLALLKQVQDKGVPLAQSMADALSLAHDCGAAELIAFCTHELAGYPFAESEAELESRRHRHMAMFCTAGEINMMALGYTGMSVFQYIDSHPEQFSAKTHVENDPIAVVEAKQTPQNQKGCWVLQRKVRDFNPSAENGDVEVSCYSRPNAYLTMVEAVRAELTRKLVALLRDPPA